MWVEATQIQPRLVSGFKLVTSKKIKIPLTSTKCDKMHLFSFLNKTHY